MTKRKNKMLCGLTSKLTRSLSFALLYVAFVSTHLTAQLADVSSVEEAMRIGDYEKAIELAQQQVEKKTWN
ncbi:MAG: hypothetical protein ACKOAH_28015, partial [Pirellula sp.]